MNNIGKDYAEALFMLACEEGQMRPYGEALELVANALRENEDYFSFLSSPNIPMSDRLESIGSVFGAYVPEHVLSFLKLMCEKGRLYSFFEAEKVYADFLSEAEKIQNVKVRSAVELTASQKEKLKEKLESMKKTTVNIEYAVDSSLIGGVVVEIDDKIIDGSLHNRLQQVKEVISK